MRNGNLAINMLSAEAWAWYQGYLAALDALDIQSYRRFLSPDVSMSFNNAAPVEGQTAVVAMLENYWKSFAALEHEPLAILGDDAHICLEALNHYRRHDGKNVSVRAVALTDRGADGRARRIRVFADASPVFA